MIGNFTAIGSASNTQPIEHKDGKFLRKNKNRFRFHAEWMTGISGSISRIAKHRNILAVARL
jgi:hypothetical protein